MEADVVLAVLHIDFRINFRSIQPQLSLGPQQVVAAEAPVRKILSLEAYSHVSQLLSYAELCR